MKRFNALKNIFWFLLMLSYTIFILQIISINGDWNLPSFLIHIARLLIFVVWIFCLVDMVKNKLYNKFFWILSMFILIPICLPSYLYLRNKLLRN